MDYQYQLAIVTDLLNSKYLFCIKMPLKGVNFIGSFIFCKFLAKDGFNFRIGNFVDHGSNKVHLHNILYSQKDF